MSVEKKRETLADQEHHEAKEEDRFPVGMRVLAVDDDQTCLNILGKMLERCCYQVTTTTQSIKALEMLRENKNQFDLVISDVNMPDMDGFKLLELVGHEMDLPVIMISGHKDINFVKKGVLHGACDYLLKPCRMQELQNIWQHVYRRQIDLKDQNKAFIEEKASNVIREGSQAIVSKAYNVTREGSQAIVSKACNVTREGSQAIVSEINADQTKQLGKRRNEQDEEEEEDDDETEQESEDPSTQKKPRLLWSNELHGKFVAAVTQLGFDKAVPKKILELMNDEGLTRENVASHLQKYRLSLRKEAQKPNTVDTLGGSDAYLKLTSLDGYASGSGRFSRRTPYASGGIFSMLNSSSGLNLRGTSSSAAWPVQSQNMNGSIKALENIQPSMFSANQSSNSLQGIPAANELNRFQQSSYTNGIRNFSPVDNLSGFTVSPVFANSRATVGNSNSHLSVFSSNHLQLLGNSTTTHNSLVLRNHHSSLGAASVSTKPFNTGICGASNLLDYNQCNESRQIAVQLSKFPANSLPLNQAFNSDQLSQNSSKFSSSTSHIQDIPIDFSSVHAVVPLEESRGGLPYQEGLIGNIVQASFHKPQQIWEQHKKDYKQSTNQSFNSLVPSNGSTSSLGNTSNQNSTIGMKRVDASLSGELNEEATLSTSQRLELEKFSSDSRMKSNDACILQQMKLDGQLNEATPSTSKHPEPEKLNSDSRTKSNDSCIMQQTKSPQEGINHSDFESLDDLIVDVVNPELNEILFMNEEIVFDDPDGSFI